MNLAPWWRVDVELQQPNHPGSSTRHDRACQLNSPFLQWAGRLLLSISLCTATGALWGAGPTPSGDAPPGRAALVEAAARGDLAQVQALLREGAPIEQRDTSGRTAVLAATQGKHVAVARVLIERGANVNAQDQIQDSAYLLAGARGYVDILRATLAAGADLTSTNRYGGTALTPACHYGHVEAVRVLLATRVDVNHVNRLGWTCLLEAVILGDGSAPYQDIVRQVIARSADLNLTDRDGVTPPQHALRRRQERVADLLRAAGAR